MRNLGLLLLSFLLAAPLTGAAQGIDGAPEGYQLVWEDNFNGSALDEKAWNIEVSGSGGGNQELQYYRRENVSVADGNLVLTARRESYQGKSFTSGRVNGNQKTAFKHGVMQARIKFPHTANGLWPAYWMRGNDINRYGWPRCGEIDIIEMGHSKAITGQYAGMQDKYFAGTTHWGTDGSYENHRFYSQEFSSDKFSSITPVANDDYHIFTIEWNGDYIYMYYDLVSYTTANKRKALYFSQNVSYVDDVESAGHYFQKPFYFLFNLAVGGTFPSIYDPAAITALPTTGSEAKMYVDWVRVYQKTDDADALYYYTDADGEVHTNIPEEPEPEPQEDDKTKLSSFATKALDEQGQSTFDFDDAYDVVLISTSEGVTGNFKSREVVLKDYNVDNDRNFLYIWEDTYVAQGRKGKENSFGWEEGYTTYYVSNKGWSGLGFASPTGKGKDVSMLDDSYWLHFALKANDVEQHANHSIMVGDAEFRIGATDGKLVSLGDFKRDGEWYYFDIPLKALRQFADPIFSGPQAYTGNVWAAMSGGKMDNEITFDNIFFYKSKSRDIPTYTDDTADLGKYGYPSLDEHGKSTFDLSLVGDMVAISLSEDMWKGVTGDGAYGEENLLKQNHDYTLNNTFYVWGEPQTLRSRKEDSNVTNSTGVYTGNVTSWASAPGAGWNGMGFATGVARDFSMIDDSYYLHFAVRSDAAVGHIPVRLRIGSENSDAIITLGQYSTAPIIGDFNRDGKWYSFDIPVAELKKYGALWSKASNGMLPASEYMLCLNTMDTYYTGSYFAFDNVFFWNRKDGNKPEVNELGDYTTKSLDAEGKSYFDFSNKDFMPVIVGASERSAMIAEGQDRIISDLSVDDQKSHMYLWEGTYEGATCVGKNSFGKSEGWTALNITDKGWSGAGIISDTGYDLSQLDENWYLHFAAKGTDESDLNLIFGKSHFTIGHKAFVNGSGEMYPKLGDFKRDNEWYSYDIPMSEFYSICSDLFPQDKGGAAAFTDNLFCFSNGTKKGDLLQIDNLFLWREHVEPAGIKDVNVEKGRVNSGATATGFYDLQGRRVADTPAAASSLPRGIYIYQGKKIVIR